MPPLLRVIVAPIAGILTAILLISVVESIGRHVFPPPAGLDFSNPDTVRAYVATMPTGAFFLILGGWLLGVFGGILIGAVIGRAHVARLAAVIGGIVLAATIGNLVLIRHPLWFSILAVLAIPTVAWIAYRVAVKLERREPAAA